MNFISGIPVLFGFIMYTGGPQSAFANWTMIGGLSCIVSLSMAEIAAALPTAGGIYFWAYRLGDHRWGPFLSWMTAWWNWMGWVCVVPGVQQGSTNFLLSALEIQYPDNVIFSKGWFAWILTSVGMLFAMAPNIISERVLKLYFRFAIFIFFTLFALYWIWFPIAASKSGHFQSTWGAFNHFYNGINLGDEKQASDAYCRTIGILFGAWVFYGYIFCRFGLNVTKITQIRCFSSSGRGDSRRVHRSSERNVDVHFLSLDPVYSDFDYYSLLHTRLRGHHIGHLLEQLGRVSRAALRQKRRRSHSQHSMGRLYMRHCQLLHVCPTHHLRYFS